MARAWRRRFCGWRGGPRGGGWCGGGGGPGRLAGPPLRWRLLSELARSDRRVGELCALAGRRQSLVSYHLRKLRDGGLVSARRSAADGRDTYYVLDLARCGELLAGAGVALHPGLAPSPPPSRPRRRRSAAVTRVLFLCTGNS